MPDFQHCKMTMSYQPIQRILVPQDISGYCQAAALRACEIARAHFSQVSGLVVLDTPEIAGCVPPGFGSQIVSVKPPSGVSVVPAVAATAGCFEHVRAAALTASNAF